MALQIDVISDVVCPWCFIGQKKLARALEVYREKNPAGNAPKVAWHPFQLNPDMPDRWQRAQGRLAPVPAQSRHARGRCRPR